MDQKSGEPRIPAFQTGCMLWQRPDRRYVYCIYCTCTRAPWRLRHRDVQRRKQFPFPARYISSLLSPFLGFSIPTFQLFMLDDFHRFFANSRSRTFRYSQLLRKNKSLRARVYTIKTVSICRIRTRIIHSLIVGTRFAYCSKGDACTAQGRPHLTNLEGRYAVAHARQHTLTPLWRFPKLIF